MIGISEKNSLIPNMISISEKNSLIPDNIKRLLLFLLFFSCINCLSFLSYTIKMIIIMSSNKKLENSTLTFSDEN